MLFTFLIWRLSFRRGGGCWGCFQVQLCQLASDFFVKKRDCFPYSLCRVTSKKAMGMVVAVILIFWGRFGLFSWHFGL
jgi:hypothetical protein